MVVIVAFILAAMICATLVIVLFPLMQRYALARPNARSSHKVPTPQGGGIAVILAASTIVAICCWAGANQAMPGLAISMLGLGVLTLGLLGLVDDIKPMKAMLRLIVQSFAVIAVAATLPVDARLLPDAVPLFVERAAIAFAALWFVNLVNFMDGIDLMTVSEVVPVSGTIALMGLIGFLDPTTTVVAVALCGAMVGFAPFNRPVARLFLGDVGSLPIGLALAWLLFHVAAQGYLAAALLLPMYYAADATITLLRRIAQRERVWEAHRSHFYQMAMRNGLSVLAIVTRVVLLNVVLALLALATTMMPAASFQIAAISVGAFCVALVLLDFARHRKPAEAFDR